MKIGLVNNCRRNETRVCATPQSVLKYTKAGHLVFIETKAGEKSGFCDNDYINSGALITQRADVLNADIILSVIPPKKSDLHSFRAGQWLICDFTSFEDKADWQDLVKTDIGVIDLGKMPRISRAQTMDILSSQALIAGYKAAVQALETLPQTVPLFMTSAGTLPPAKAVVIGAGVAGLQAISTLKRMGANVVATDIRPESQSEIESVGAKFTNRIEDEISSANILITCAFTNGKKAPLLITKKQIEQLPSFSVVIDMAEGNVEQGFERSDIKFISDKHFERKLPHPASILFSNNVQTLLSNFHFLSDETNYSDEIMRQILICSDGFLRRKIK